MEEIEAFRYRARDAWRAVTRIAVREARIQEIKIEMMQSKKLKVTQPQISFLNFVSNSTGSYLVLYPLVSF